MKKIIERSEEFKQVCCWPGIFVPEEEKEEFENYLEEHFGCRFKYLETIKTLPDQGDTTGETGGRPDVIFAVHTEDIGKFAVPRLKYGIRWIEDVFGNMDNQNNVYYPEYLRGYCTWDFGLSADEVDEVIKAKMN